jgi:hypothetical protein
MDRWRSSGKTANRLRVIAEYDVYDLIGPPSASLEEVTGSGNVTDKTGFEALRAIATKEHICAAHCDERWQRDCASPGSAVRNARTRGDEAERESAARADREHAGLARHVEREHRPSPALRLHARRRYDNGWTVEISNAKNASRA